MQGTSSTACGWSGAKCHSATAKEPLRLWRLWRRILPVTSWGAGPVLLRYRQEHCAVLLATSENR